MDGIIITVLSLALLAWNFFKPWPEGQGDGSQEIAGERIVKNTALNPEMIHDEHAFMVIANELGFH